MTYHDNPTDNYTDDYTDDDRYDWDRNDDRQYCQHGTFIGSWWGPDILCMWCENGATVEEMRDYYRTEKLRDAQAIVGKYDHAVDIFQKCNIPAWRGIALLCEFVDRDRSYEHAYRILTEADML